MILGGVECEVPKAPRNEAAKGPRGFGLRRGVHSPVGVGFGEGCVLPQEMFVKFTMNC